ncbi:MAG TPA: hypothetical protein VIR58_09020 [Acidimicrobiales bacterium]
MPSSSARVIARTVALVVAVVLASAAPASADPAGPSDFRSEVTGISPATEGVDAEIRGGDSFLELTVSEGIEVIVEGYSDEPYLRFRADGTVERNLASPATYLNEDRKGGGELPEIADEDADPQWEQVATDGTYSWHDHRVHWMSEASPSVDRGERVPGEYDPWRVPLVVGGQEVVVEGTLTYESATSPLPWLALGLVVAGFLAWLGRRAPLLVGAAALAVVSIAAVVVGRGEMAETPDGSGNPLLWLLPLAAAVLAVGALALGKRSAAVIMVLGSVATLSGWALLRFAVLTKPVLPTELPAHLDRATVALALAASATAAYQAVTSGHLALRELEDD